MATKKEIEIKLKSTLDGKGVEEALLLINIQSGELKNLKNGLDQMKKDLEQAKNNIEGLRRRKH